jgi:hypothetical protein
MTGARTIVLFDINRVYLTAILNALSFNKMDLEPLFALCLVYGIVTNNGVEKQILEDTNLIPSVVDGNLHYHADLVGAIIQLIEKICNNGESDCNSVITGETEGCMWVLNFPSKSAD